MQRKEGGRMEATTKIAVFLLVAFSVLTSTESQTRYRGHWKLLKRSIGISAMHMQLLPNGRVVTFDRTDFGPSNISLPAGRCRWDPNDKGLTNDCTAHSIEFDPATRAVRPLMVDTDTWCSSGALYPNGTLVQTGGEYDGNRTARLFSPCENCDWVEIKNALVVRRWYATNHVLPDGKIIVVGGQGQFNYEFVPKVSPSDNSLFDLPFLEETTDWRGKENNLYPFVHLSPDGNLFIFANKRSILLDYVKNRVVRTFPVIPGRFARNYPSTGSSVLLPLHLDRKGGARAEVMVCGGTAPTSVWMANKGIFWPATDTCGRLVITDELPEWVMEEMPVRRTMGDMLLLPTGDVLIINGAMNGTASWYIGREPALNPVLYLTESRTFEVLAPAVIPRLYHSTAVLLPDGRVLVGGSNPNEKYEFTRTRGRPYPTELSLEAFYPPYSGPMAPRPTITAVRPGTEVRYGDRLSIEWTMRGEWEGVRVTMVAPSFNTHSFSMNQRLLVLVVEDVRYVSGRSYAVDVIAPATATLAPPGYYLVFVVHGGFPSHGTWVRIMHY